MNSEKKNIKDAGTPCTRCHGTGMVICVICNGRGKNEGGQPCANCNGRGHVPCPACNGTGHNTTYKHKQH